MPTYPLTYPYRLYFIVKKSRKDDLLNFLDNHPNVAAKLGLADVVGNEVVKITVDPPPNSGSVVQVLGCSAAISTEQREFWIQIKDEVPPAWQDDVDGTIKKHENIPAFDDWLASLTPALYRIVVDEEP